MVSGTLLWYQKVKGYSTSNLSITTVHRSLNVPFDYRWWGARPLRRRMYSANLFNKAVRHRGIRLMSLVRGTTIQNWSDNAITVTGRATAQKMLLLEDWWTSAKTIAKYPSVYPERSRGVDYAFVFANGAPPGKADDPYPHNGLSPKSIAKAWWCGHHV